MSHRHFCDAAGHEWECEGRTLRPLAGDTEPSVCMCQSCQAPMEEGDHSECSIELLACSEHMDEQLRQMGYEPGTSNMPRREQDAASSMLADENGQRTIGFCLWCCKDFYAIEEVEEHNAKDMAACPVFQELHSNHQRAACAASDAGRCRCVAEDGDCGTVPEIKE